MGRAQRRAERRAEAKLERGSNNPSSAPGGDSSPPVAVDLLEREDEAARRVYRSGGKPERGGKTGRASREKPRKWREGRQ